MPETGVADLQSPRLAAIDTGPPERPPIVALHGWLDNAASFTPLARHLPERRLLALDLAGHGHSQHRGPGFGYHLLDYLWEIDQTLDALGLSRIRLLGHSLGGALASLYAGLRPQRVEGLICIDALGPLTDPLGQTRSRLIAALNARAGLSDKRRRTFSDIEQAVAARRQAGDLSESAARLLVERGLEPDGDGWRWRSDPRLTLPSPLRLSEAQVVDILAGIVCPTLVILADPAPAFMPNTLDQRGAAIVDLRIERLPGSHHLHMEDPAPVAALIESFLKTRLDSLGEISEP